MSDPQTPSSDSVRSEGASYALPQPAAPAHASLPAPGAPAQSGGALSITALVLGASAVLLAVIPFLAFAAYLPAIAGVVFGIVALVQRARHRGIAIAGLVTSGASLPLAMVTSVVTGVIIASLASIASTGSGIDGGSSQPVGPMTVDSVTRGSGDQDIVVAPYDGVGEYGYAHITAEGTGAFLVIGRDDSGAELERLVDDVAPYDGYVLWNLSSGVEVSRFDIVADAEWTVAIDTVDAIPEIEDGATRAGTGDDVLWYGGSDTPLLLSPEDGALGYLWATSSAEPWLCDSRSGEECRTELPGDGGAFVQIFSDGDWALTLGGGAVSLGT